MLNNEVNFGVRNSSFDIQNFSILPLNLITLHNNAWVLSKKILSGQERTKLTRFIIKF
jgi:hypothetical protein